MNDLISAYIDGALAPSEAGAVRAHIAACPDCRADYVELKAAQRMLRSVPTVMPPRAFTLTEEMVAARPRQGSLLQRLFAPSSAPRLATGAALAFALMLFVVIGDLGVNRQLSSPTALTAQAPQSSALSDSARPETGGARSSAMMDTTATTDGPVGLLPQAEAGGTPTAGIEAPTAPPIAASVNSSPNTTRLEAQPGVPKQAPDVSTTAAPPMSYTTEPNDPPSRPAIFWVEVGLAVLGTALVVGVLVARRRRM